MTDFIEEDGQIYPAYDGGSLSIVTPIKLAKIIEKLKNTIKELNNG